MKKLYIAFALLCLIAANTTKAQSGSGWDWASTSTMATYSPGRQVVDITSDAAGNVYATGRFQGSMTLGAHTIATTGDGSVSYNFDEDAFVVKYNAAGTVQWLKRFGIAATASNQGGESISVDADGNVYVGGFGMSIYTTNSAFLVKYDNNGNLLWSKTDFPLYEVGGIDFGPDSNPIVMESFQSTKNIYKINKSTGALIWTVTNTNVGSNSGSTYKDFIDDAGNIYYTCFNASAANTTVAGQSFTTTGLTSYVASITNDGVTRWVQKIDNKQIQLGYTNDRFGNSYIQFSGGFGGTFQGISTASPIGNNYFELNNAGTVTRYLTASPYKGPFRVKDDGIYGFATESGGTTATVIYGDYFFTLPAASTKALGIVIKYNKTNDAVIWANSLEITGASYNAGKINAIEPTATNKVVVGGLYGTSIKTGTNTYTVATSTGSTPSDLYIAQFSNSGVLPPASTNWTGNANNMNWNDANNWTNGIPNGNMKTNILAGASNYPTNIPTTVIPARLEIGAGVVLQLPLNFSSPLGILNNGTIEITESGYFYGGFNTGATEVSGTGKVVIKNSATSFFAFKTLNNSLEINCPTGNVSSLGGTIGGSLILTSGKLVGSASTALVLSNPNATISFTETSYFIGLLKRAVNASGTYIFPVGEFVAPSSYTAVQPVTITLNNIVGPQYLSVVYTKTINGSAPNTTAQGVSVTSLLNTGIWTITPDVAVSGGSYNVTLEARTFTNSITDATRYVVLKRNNSSSAWAFFGNNGLATYFTTAITATAGNISGFSDFAIGIATSSVAATTLPVSFISFDAKANGSAALLNWQTATEINNARFDIEHSTDGNNWNKVGEVLSLGSNSNTTKAYSYLHTNTAKGNNYYRLKQVDIDGRFEYSATRLVNISANRDVEIVLYPNPVKNKLYITGVSSNTINVSLLTLSGKIITTAQLQNNILNIPQTLPNGTYLVQITTESSSLSKLILVNR